VREIIANNGILLFVGTKRQAQETIQAEAMRCSMPYVTARWLGGMLTNWRTIRQRINELERLERMRDSGEISRLTKKEGLIISREIERLEGLLGGVRKLARLPNAIFVVDVSRESTAIHEANLLNIPVVGMVDTNCDPHNIDYIIPSNDDAIRAIKLVVGKMADAVLEGLAMRKEEVVEEDTFRAAARGAVEEVELTDEELLGEATLAKIAPRVVVYEETEAESVEEIPDEVILEVEDEEIEIDEEDLKELGINLIDADAEAEDESQE